MNMMRKKYIFLLGFFFISGCASSISSNVTRFHQLPMANGESIEVVALDPTQQQSIEFATYAQMVGKKLGDVGYTPPVNNRSQYIAEIGYSIVAFGDTVIENRSPVSVGVGVGSGSRRGTSMGVGISTGFGSSNTDPQYLSRLTMNIIDLTTGNRLYEGHVESINRGQNLSQTMPILINALFEDFPGESGTSNIVKVTP